MTTFTLAFYKRKGNDTFAVSYEGNPLLPVSAQKKEGFTSYLKTTYGMFFNDKTIDEKVQNFIKKAEELTEDSSSISENIYFNITETRKIRDKLDQISYFYELNDYEQSRIEDFVQNAIDDNSVSFDIEIELGRSPITDSRIYALRNMSEYSSNVGEYQVKDFI